MSFRFRHGDRLLDGYTIQRGVGRGAFGEVYYAISDGGREVALKAILQNQDVELRGIQHCINLKSPHLVSIFDVRESDDGTPIVIMEYVAGPSLRDLLHEHPNGLGTQRAAYLLREIAKGLTYLHEHGVVHRDLKPENLFYEDGYVKICDYGLSKYVSVSRQSGQTMSVGTVHYMAPEIGSGIYNQSIDIYALGVILHELLTGAVPFTGDSFGEILMKHLTAEPDLSAIEEPFRSVVARALEKKPEDRYQKVDEMARQIFLSADITKSVHLFNPQSLSAIARRRQTPQLAGPAVAPGEKAGPLGTPKADEPPPLPGEQIGTPPPQTRIPSGWPPRTSKDPTKSPEKPLTEPPRDPPPPWKRDRDAESAASGSSETADAPKPAVGGSPRKRRGPATRKPATPGQATPGQAAAGPFKSPTESPERLDPLDSSHRLGRTSFVILATAAGVTVLDLVENGMVGLFGFLLATVSSTWAVISTENFLAPRYKIAEGFPRRLCVGALALLPIGASASLLELGREPDTAIYAILLTLLLIDWSRRLDPMREERLVWGEAFTAGLLAFILGVIFEFGDGNAFVGAIALATVSLAVNAYSPFVPHDIRKKAARTKRRRDAARSPHGDDADGIGSSWHEDLESPRGHGVPSRQGVTSSQTDEAWSRVGRPRGSEMQDLPPRPPGHVARVFWLFVGAVCIAGGLCCLIIPTTVHVRHPDERLVYASIFLGAIGFLGFCLYRGLWARKRTFWGRSLRPFLLTCLGNTSAIGAYLFFMAPAEGAWRIRGEEALASICVSLGALVLLVLLVAFDRLTRPDERVLRHASHLPRPERPVQPFVRLFELLIATSGSAFALGFVIIAFFAEHVDEWDRAGLLGGAVGAGIFGIFFAHQALRYRRGHIWESTLRPLLLAASSATIGISTVFLVLRPSDVRPEYWGAFVRRVYHPFPDDGVILCVVLTIVAAVFGIFAFFVRGPGRELSRSRLFWWHAPPGQTRARAAKGSGWSGLGTLCWTFSVVAVVAGAALRCGIGEALAIDQKLGVAGYEFLSALIGPSWLALGGSVVASFCVLLGRRDGGAIHVTRALLGQVCLIAAGATIFEIGDLLNVSQVAGHLVFSTDGPPGQPMFLLNTTFVIGVLGTMSLVWPRRRTPELDNTDTDADTDANISAVEEE